MLAQDFVHQLYTDSSAIVEFGCSWKMAQCPPLKDHLLGIFRKSKGHLATLLQQDSIGMLLGMHNFRSASEDTDSTATSQDSMMTWVPFDFIACKVWENLLRLQSSWHLLGLTSHFRIKKGRPTSCSCLDHMVIFDELNLWNPSPLCCYRPRWSWFACTRCWAPSSARIFPWREVKTKRFMPSSTWVLSEKRVLRQTKVGNSNKYTRSYTAGKTATKQQSFLFNTFVRGLYATQKQLISVKNHMISNKKRLQSCDALLELNSSPTKCQC